MSILVRYKPPSLTAEQYDEGDRLLREAGVDPLPDGLEYHVCFGPEGTLRVSEIWDSRKQFEAYGRRLMEMPVFADIPFDSGGPPRDPRGAQDPQALAAPSRRARVELRENVFYARRDSTGRSESRLILPPHPPKDPGNGGVLSGSFPRCGAGWLPKRLDVPGPFSSGSRRSWNTSGTSHARGH
jgi:hypothetical protein